MTGTAERHHSERVKVSRCTSTNRMRETKEIKLEGTKVLRAEHTDF